VPQSFLGSWRLVSCEFRSASGEVNYPLGRDVAGQISYDAGGRMSAQLMQRGQQPFASENMYTANPAEQSRAWSCYVGYFGSYTVDEAAGTVTHFVEGSWFPNWVGTSQVRHFRFEGNRLELSSKADQGVYRIVWEKI
jgi:Lipocalin-like domain